MYEHIHSISGKLRWPILGIFTVLAILVIFSFIPHIPESNARVAASSPSASNVSMYDGSNAITGGLSAAAGDFKHTIGAKALHPDLPPVITVACSVHLLGSNNCCAGVLFFCNAVPLPLDVTLLTRLPSLPKVYST